MKLSSLFKNLQMFIKIKKSDTNYVWNHRKLLGRVIETKELEERKITDALVCIWNVSPGL